MQNWLSYELTADMPTVLWHCWLGVRNSIWSSWYHCIPKRHCLLAHLKPDLFYLSGTGLPRLSWKRGRSHRCCSSSCSGMNLQILSSMCISGNQEARGVYCPSPVHASYQQIQHWLNSSTVWWIMWLIVYLQYVYFTLLRVFINWTFLSAHTYTTI